MRPIQQLLPVALAEIVRRQPPSPARTSFAWQVAVGPAVARATAVELVSGTLYVKALDPRWIAEVTRAQDSVLTRLKHLLGPDEIRRISTA